MSAFSQRHYEKVAAVLKAEREYLEFGPDKDVYELNRIGILLADMFKADNPRFQLERFHKACQP